MISKEGYFPPSWHNIPPASRPSLPYRLFAIILEHTTLRRTPSGQVISPTQRPLPDNTQHYTTDKHPCLRRDSKKHSQQARGSTPTPQTARPLGSAQEGLEFTNIIIKRNTALNSVRQHNHFITQGIFIGYMFRL